ncbi:MAG: threonylcarbamoyl-AMP synthase [Bryobacterales bacterium]|nr:threonylcarbamoyl-AMP synthase [Bryobacterales bacterium]MBV9398083.1 threonylcarbamoyl-AMP synthase [Bryobacterales bacterium]
MSLWSKRPGARGQGPDAWGQTPDAWSRRLAASSEGPGARAVQAAAEKIRRGGLVAFPTETVYGLGANALDESAVQKIYDLKGRPATSPLIVHVASIDMARGIVAEWPALAEELARRWWPGPLTLVLPKRSEIPDIVTAGLPTVGVRMPSHPVALELIEAAGVPVAAPSANRFTGVSPTTAEHVRAAFGDAVDVLDGGPCQVGIESTVVAIQNGQLKLLRPGMLSLGDLEPQTAPSGEAHPAPGMSARHYSPRTPVLLVAGPEALPDCRGAYVWRLKPASAARTIRMPEDAAAYAARFYSVLHDLDAENRPWIAVELPPDTPEWAAIHDRLRRASTRVDGREG